MKGPKVTFHALRDISVYRFEYNTMIKIGDRLKRNFNYSVRIDGKVQGNLHAVNQQRINGFLWYLDDTLRESLKIPDDPQDVSLALPIRKLRALIQGILFQKIRCTSMNRQEIQDLADELRARELAAGVRPNRDLIFRPTVTPPLYFPDPETVPRKEILVLHQRKFLGRKNLGKAFEEEYNPDYSPIPKWKFDLDLKRNLMFSRSEGPAMPFNDCKSLIRHLVRNQVDCRQMTRNEILQLTEFARNKERMKSGRRAPKRR